jgi:hypothetical protein
MKDNSSENISCTDEDFKATLEVVGGQAVEICVRNISPDGLKHYQYEFRTSYLLAAGQLKCNSIARIPYPAASLKGTDVKFTDLRGSMGLVLAGLLAKGVTRVENVWMALRGYNNLLSKLSKLGIEYRLLEGSDQKHS